MTTFKQLGLSNEVLKALTELGFETPSEIQQQAIPQLLAEDKDFIGLAQTGTGKTAAFGLPLLERMDPFNKSTQALVLAPTRELGQQIAEQIELYSKYMDKMNVLAVYGGAAISTQMKALRQPQQIIIATPGRLIDLIGRKSVKLDQLQYLVLDEADEMLNMGFKEDIDKILSFTPKEKLTWLFSATMPTEIKRIVNKYMHEPIEVKVNTKNEVNTNIEHQYVVVKQSDKSEALTRFLDINKDMRGVVFCRTKRDTQNLAEELLKKNYKADALHGDLSQQQRDRVMKRFKAHDLQVLIATDVAARGIDVNDLTHVFHYTLPDDNSYYTHRSGRTARAGKQGISISFINGREGYKIKRIEKDLGISIAQVFIPKVEDITDIRIENWCNELLDIKTRNKFSPELLEKVSMIFGNLSKEELISKLLAFELKNLDVTGSKDLNDIHSKGDNRDRSDRRDRKNERGDGRRDRKRKDDRRDDSRNSRDGRERRDRKDSRDRKGKSGSQPRYFINMGSRDKINKQDLVDFICTVSKLKHSDIGNIELQSSHSYFEVDEKVHKKIGNRFDGILLEDGRELRVNRDK